MVMPKSVDIIQSQVSLDDHDYDRDQTGRRPEIDSDMPPDGGYGWVCVACMFLINAHTWGLNSSYAVILAHYLVHNTLPGATDLHYAFIGGLSIAMAMIVSPLATSCTGKFGTKFSLYIGIVLEFAGLMGASWSTQIWHLFLSQGLAFGLGMGFLYMASVGVVPQWFSTKRSFANSTAAAGSGLGGMMYSLATGSMIESIGLGWAFRVLAIITVLVNMVCTILLKDRNKAVGAVHIAFDLKLFKRAELYPLLAWGFFSLWGYILLLFSLPSYARNIGLSAHQGSVIGALLNLGQGLGRPVVGYFGDTLGPINVASGCTFLAGFYCLVIWIFSKSFEVLIFFALIVGTVSGTYWAMVAPVTAEVVGIPALPSALSIIFITSVIPSLFAEPVGLRLRSTGADSYLHAQIFTGIMYLAAAICAWFVRVWKIDELDRQLMAPARRGDIDRLDHASLEFPVAPPIPLVSYRANFAKNLSLWRRV